MVASVILVLYVIFVFVLFLPQIGLGIFPVLFIAVFAGFVIIGSVFYNGWTTDAVVVPDQDSTDLIYLLGLTVTAIVSFFGLLFVMWFIYTHVYRKSFNKPIEDISIDDMVKTPFTSEKNY